MSITTRGTAQRAATCIVFAAVALAGLVGCSAANNTFTVNGKLSVAGEGGSSAGGACSPSEGYDDIAEGTSVVVMDAAGKTIAIGKLGAGETGSYLLACNYKFKVTGVPVGAKFYKVEVSHRGAVQYTEKQMHQTLDLSLG